MPDIDVVDGIGYVELHGCNVAQGYAGKMYLARLAQTLHDPVRAGTAVQLAGSRENDLFLWGQWREARPARDGGASFHVYVWHPRHAHAH